MIISYEIGISFPRVDLHREGKKQHKTHLVRYNKHACASRTYSVGTFRMIFKPRAHFGHSFGLCPTKPFKIITRLNAHQLYTPSAVTTFNYWHYIIMRRFFFLPYIVHGYPPKTKVIIIKKSERHSPSRKSTC